MYKLLMVLMAAFIFSCTSNKTEENTTPVTDTLMDSTQMKMKADTTMKMLDHLEDSINRLRNNAAENADQKN